MEARDYMTKHDVNREIDKINQRLTNEEASNKQDRHEIRTIMTKQNDHLAKIDGHLETIGQKVDGIDKKVSKHEKDLYETEKWKARLEGQIQVLRWLVVPVAVGVAIYVVQFVFNAFIG